MAYHLNLPYQAHTNAYFEWDSVPEQVRYFGLSTNSPVNPENLPREATRQRGKQTPDVFPMPGLNAVNARFRELVERFEPDKHLFHPIHLKEPGGSRVEGEHYIFCARMPLDSVLTVRSRIEWKQDAADEYPPHAILHDRIWETHRPDHPKSLAKREAKFGVRRSAEARGQPVLWPQHLYVSGLAVAGHHIWTGDRLFSNGIWVSDAFFAAFEKAKLKALQSDVYGFEVDVPWVAEQELAPVLEWERSHS